MAEVEIKHSGPTGPCCSCFKGPENRDKISALRSYTHFWQEEDAVQDVLFSTTLQLLSLPTLQASSANLLLSHAEQVFF